MHSASKSPTRGATFLVFDRTMNAAVKRGSKACPEVSHRVALALTSDREAVHVARMSVPGVLAAERQVYGFLRARCGLCQMKCDDPVL